MRPLLAASTAVLAATMLVVVAGGQGAGAIAVSVPLGTAGSFSVLGGQSVTNTGPSVLSGDLGVWPGSDLSGFGPATVLGAVHQTDAVALQAQSDVTTAYNNAAGQAVDGSLPPDAGGLTLVGGVYNASSALGLTGPLTLDAQGNPDTVWVFQVGSELTTASASSVVLVNGAQACNVFWQIGSSATLGTGSTFVGTLIALTSVSATTGATIQGRLFARNGSVTLDTNVITTSACTVVPPPDSTTAAPATSTPGEVPTTVDQGGATTIDAGATTTPGGGATTTPGGATTTPGGGPTTGGTPITPPPSGVLTVPPTNLTLPATGSETGETAIAATFILVFGVGVLLVARRRVRPG